MITIVQLRYQLVLTNTISLSWRACSSLSGLERCGTRRNFPHSIICCWYTTCALCPSFLCPSVVIVITIPVVTCRVTQFNWLQTVGVEIFHTVLDFQFCNLTEVNFWLYLMVGRDVVQLLVRQHNTSRFLFHEVESLIWIVISITSTHMKTFDC